MSAAVVAVIPPGRIFAYGDLYPRPADPVAHAQLARPQQVEINEVGDYSLDLHFDDFFRYVRRFDLVTRGA